MKYMLHISAVAALFLFGCLKTKNPVSSLPIAPLKSIVAVSISLDYSEGNMGEYSILDSVVYKNRLSIHSDNDIRTYNGAMYVLERYGKDNIIKISGSIISDSTVAYQKNIGASVNIQDIAFINDIKAYITQYAASKVVIFNPSTGMASAKTVDLSPFNTYAGTDSADTIPYVGKELCHLGKVYIICQRLKAPKGGFVQAADTSLIAVVNGLSDSVETSIRLRYKNPQELAEYNGKLYVASAGIYGINDGGIECIDLSTGLNEGTVADETTLNGDVESIIVVSDTKGYAVISTPTFTTELHAFNPRDKTVGAKISGIDNPCGNHMAFYGGSVYIGDRSTTSPGIVQIDTTTDAKVGITRNIGIPPNSLGLLELN